MPLAPPTLLPLLDPLLVHGPGLPPGRAPRPNQVGDYGGGAGIWIMRGATRYGVATLPSVPSPWYMVGVGEFNLDGMPDIVWSGPNGENAVWLMWSTSVRSSVWLPRVPDANWSIAGVADFNGDSYADLLWRNSSTGQNGIWFMHGATVYATGWLPTVPDPFWHVSGLGDFNHDGYADIVWSSWQGENNLWYMRGSTFLGWTSLPRFFDWEIAGAGDLNADGWSDLIWTSVCRYCDWTWPDTHDNGVWFMRNTQVLSTALIGQTPYMSWMIRGVGDFNNDGWNDIVWRE